MAKTLIYVSSVKATGSGTGTWADPYSTITGALAAASTANQIRVLSGATYGHVESPSATSTWSLGTAPTAGTLARCEICVVDDTTDVELSATVGNRLNVNPNSVQYNINHSLVIKNIDFVGPTGNHIYLNVTRVSAKQHFSLHNCGLDSGTGKNSGMLNPGFCEYFDCTFGAGNGLLVAGVARVYGGTFAATFASATLIAGVSNQGGVIDLYDVDASGVTGSTPDICSGYGEIEANFHRCKLPTGIAIFNGTNPESAKVRLLDSYIGSTQYRDSTYTPYTTTTYSTATYLTAGIGASLSYTPVSGGNPAGDFVFDHLYTGIHDLTTAKTATVELLSDGTLHEDDIYIRASYINSAGTIVEMETTLVAVERSTPVALTASSHATTDWTHSYTTPTTYKAAFAFGADASAATALLKIEAGFTGAVPCSVSPDVVVA